MIDPDIIQGRERRIQATATYQEARPVVPFADQLKDQKKELEQKVRSSGSDIDRKQRELAEAERQHAENRRELAAIEAALTAYENSIKPPLGVGI